MIPTSLDVAGFAPAQGEMPSEASSFGSRWQSRASDASEQGTSFQQVMSSYSRSHQDSETEHSRPNPSKEQTDNQDARPTDSASQPAPGATPPLTGRSGLPNGNQENQEASPEESTTGGESAEAPQANPEAVATAALSTMQLLLHGGSVAQIQTASGSGNAVSGSTLAMSQSLPGRDTKQGGAKGKAASELHRVDVNHMLFAAGQGTSSLIELTGDESASSDPSALATARGIENALRGATEALSAGSAGQNGAVAKPEATNFAFAVRLTTEGGTTPESQAGASAVAAHNAPSPALEASHPLATAAAVGGEAALAEAPEPGEHHEQDPNGAASMFAFEQPPSGRAEQSGDAAPEEPAAPATPDAEPAGSAQSEPVRNIRLQLPGDSNQHVDVRLVEVGGEMRVSVRAGDTKLAQTLQEHIPELTTRLDGQHVRAEVWAPRTESASSSNAPNQGGQPSRGDSNPSGQDSQRRQQNGQQRNQPDWVEDLENYSSPNQTSRSNQIWPR